MEQRKEMTTKSKSQKTMSKRKSFGKLRLNEMATDLFQQKMNEMRQELSNCGLLNC